MGTMRKSYFLDSDGVLNIAIIKKMGNLLHPPTLQNWKFLMKSNHH